MRLRVPLLADLCDPVFEFVADFGEEALKRLMRQTDVLGDFDSGLQPVPGECVDSYHTRASRPPASDSQ